MSRGSENTPVTAEGREAGFTLIETIISVVIILFAVAGLFAIFTTSIASRNAPQPFETGVGARYVQEGLEAVYGDRRNPARGFSYIVQANYPAEAALGGGYGRTTTIGPWPVDTDQTAFQQITVRVTRRGMVVATGVGLVANYDW